MKSKIKTPFSRVPRNYPELLMFFMPRAIHDEIDYENTVEVIDLLAGHNLTHDQEQYLDTLSTLLEAYEENQAVALPNTTPVQILKALMAEQDMSAADLGKLLGERTLGSKILRGERKIGLTYARLFAKKFAVDIGLFLA